MSDLVDTHCHIQSAGIKTGEPATRELWAKAPDINADDLIKDAVANNVTHMICVGCDLEDSRSAVKFATSRKNCWSSIGLHPHEAQNYAGDSKKLKEFEKLLDNPKVVAIGECGFDFYYSHSPEAQQTEVLKFQIELALAHNLPLIFHVREAFDSFWEVFDQYQGIRGVIHSFTDSEANLSKALERGLHIGVNGIATFTKNQPQLDVYKKIPLQKLLLETDAPFLTPSPYRGSINEPKNVVEIARFLAELRDENLAELAENTTNNARQLFGI